MLKITSKLNEGEARLILEGRLAGEWVRELQRSWDEVRGSAEKLVLDLSNVTYIDNAGRAALAELRASGAEFIAAGTMTRYVVECICGKKDKAQPAAKHNCLKSLLAFLLVCFGSAAAPAQNGPLKLTLRDAVQLALKQNPQVQAATIRLAQSQQDRRIATAELLPQVGGAISKTRERANYDSLLGVSSPNGPTVIGPFDFGQSGANASMAVFDLSLWRRYQAAGDAVNATREQVAATREQMVLLVVSQYLGALRAEANLKAVAARVELGETLYHLASDLQENGAGTGIDTLRANVQLQNERQRQIVAQNAYRTTLYGLTRLLNVDPQQQLELTDSVSFFQTPEFEPAPAVEDAWLHRPELKAMDFQLKAANRTRQAADALRLPSFQAGGQWAYQGLSAGSSIPIYQFTASLRMPLFTGGKIAAETSKARLEIMRLGRERQDLKNRVAMETKVANDNLESARHEVEVANLGLELAKQQVEQSRDRFEAGVANNVEVIQAQDELARAADNQISALYRYNQARADLAHALGQIEQLYTK